MMVFRGQGSEQVGRHPFEVLNGIISQLSIAARSDPDLAAAVGRRLGDHRDAAIAAVPELAGVLGWQSLSLLGPEAFGEARSIEALSSFSTPWARRSSRPWSCWTTASGPTS